MKNVLITGASSDFGSALINLIKDDSLRIITTGFQKNLSKINDYSIEYNKLNFSNLDEVEIFGNEMAQIGIDYYIQLNGDILENENLLSFDHKNFQYLMNVNLNSTILLLKIVLPSMIRNKFGRILLMSTASANHGGGEQSFSYGLAKHSVEYLVKHITKFYTKNNILINSLAPGLIHTRFHTERMSKDNDALQKRASTVRIGRTGSANDVAKLIYSLIFDNEFVAGQNIKIDGGDFI